MDITMYQVDAFTDHLFGGNPAAVCLLDTWLDDDILQAIAAENNLSETAFLVPRDVDYHIRWFTPLTEVDLCGHATLAAGYVVLNILEPQRDQVEFQSHSGALTVAKAKDDYLVMNLPTLELAACEAPAQLVKFLGTTPLETYRSKDYLAVLESEQQVRDLKPDFACLSKLDLRGIIVTAKGDHIDFVSRFFTPKLGVNEDPVTGSAHCQLTPYWAEKYGKTHLQAKQVSKRQGDLLCELQGARVVLKGKAVLYFQGQVKLS